MIRPVTCVCLMLAAGSGLYLYQTKHQAQLTDREIERVLKAADAAHQRAGILRAEYALLNEPQRLSDLATHHLVLAKTDPAQFTSLADLDKRLPPVPAPEPPPDAAPAETPTVSLPAAADPVEPPFDEQSPAPAIASTMPAPSIPAPIPTPGTPPATAQFVAAAIAVPRPGLGGSVAVHDAAFTGGTDAVVISAPLPPPAGVTSKKPSSFPRAPNSVAMARPAAVATSAARPAAAVTTFVPTSLAPAAASVPRQTPAPAATSTNLVARVTPPPMVGSSLGMARMLPNSRPGSGTIIPASTGP